MSQGNMQTALVEMLNDVDRFARHSSGLILRGYQRAVAHAICQSVTQGLGLSLVVMFPRQSGKNELQAQIEAYLLTLFSQGEGEIVKISPTWKPQSLNAMRRLERVLKRSLLPQLAGGTGWKKENGYIFRVGGARMFFLSGAPEAHIVGATASALLEVDEAQDVQIGKFDRDIAPMAASTHATRVFWGTAWTANTLLARELRAAREAEARDGIRRAFVLGADEVSREVPAYGRFVAEQVARLGRTHPLVRTQFFSEEIDAGGGMFPVERMALMRGEHDRCVIPHPGSGDRAAAFLVDVAGEDEGAQVGGELANPQRDATALTIVEVDLSTLEDEGLRAPRYRVLDRRVWVGARQTALYGQIVALANTWNPRYVVVDATGVGAGLASFLEKALPGRVLPFTFTAASKSKLGWDFLAVCDTGRFLDYRDAEPGGAGESFWRQAAACQYSVQPGPARLMRWSVPDGARDPASGQPLHDDLLISAALCAVLDGQPWYSSAPAEVISRRDPIAEMDQEWLAVEARR